MGKIIMKKKVPKKVKKKKVKKKVKNAPNWILKKSSHHKKHKGIPASITNRDSANWIVNSHKVLKGPAIDDGESFSNHAKAPPAAAPTTAADLPVPSASWKKKKKRGKGSRKPKHLKKKQRNLHRGEAQPSSYSPTRSEMDCSGRQAIGRTPCSQWWKSSPEFQGYGELPWCHRRKCSCTTRP